MNSVGCILRSLGTHIPHPEKFRICPLVIRRKKKGSSRENRKIWKGSINEKEGWEKDFFGTLDVIMIISKAGNACWLAQWIDREEI